MSPLKIRALLDLYISTRPLAYMTIEQATSPAMRKAFEWFGDQGLLQPGVDFESALSGTASLPLLSERGLDVVQRLKEIEP